MIKEDYNNSNKTIADFMNEIKAIYAKYFPNSSCDVKFTTNFGSTVWIDCYLAKDRSEFPHGIAQNDTFGVTFDIQLNDDNAKSKNDSMPEDGILMSSVKNAIQVKPENDYYYCSYVKVPFRKTKGNADKILKTFDKFVKKLYDMTKEQYDNNNLLNDKMKLAKSKL